MPKAPATDPRATLRFCVSTSEAMDTSTMKKVMSSVTRSENVTIQGGMSESEEARLRFRMAVSCQALVCRSLGGRKPFSFSSRIRGFSPLERDITPSTIMLRKSTSS